MWVPVGDQSGAYAGPPSIFLTLPPVVATVKRACPRVKTSRSPCGDQVTQSGANAVGGALTTRRRAPAPLRGKTQIPRRPAIAILFPSREMSALRLKIRSGARTWSTAPPTGVISNTVSKSTELATPIVPRGELVAGLPPTAAGTTSAIRQATPIETFRNRPGFLVANSVVQTTVTSLLDNYHS